MENIKYKESVQNFIPKNLDLKYVDKVEMVSNNDAFKYMKLLAKTEGIFVGISSGAVLTESKKH